MEEDIKRIKDLIEKCKECKLHECINCEISWTEVQSIENLIKGYKEKEESEQYLYEVYQDAGKKMFEYAEQLEDSIPKSKVKEKIEELDKDEKQELKGTKGQDRYYIKQKYMYKRSSVQELLED